MKLNAEPYRRSLHDGRRIHAFRLIVILAVSLTLSGCSLLPAQLEKIAGIAGTPNAGAAPTATVAPPTTSTASLIKGRSKLRVGIRFDAPPLASVTTDGKLEGLDVDIAREFARRWLGSPDNVEFVQVTSASAPRRIEEREVDFALGGLIHTKQALTHADFGLTYMYDGEALLIRTGSFTDFPSLARHRVTYIDSPSTQALGDAQIASNITLTIGTAPSYDAAIRQLRDTQTDAVVGRWRRLRTEAGRDPALTVLTVFQREPVAIMLPRNDSDWSTFVNIALSALFSDGTFAKMYKKWFNQPPEPVYPLPNAIDLQLVTLPDKIALHDALGRIRNDARIRIGFIAQSDPLATLDANGNAVGFEVDICRELARRWLQNPTAAEFTATPANDIPGLLRGNGLDMAIGGIIQTQTNARMMDFSVSTYQNGVGIAVLQTSTTTDLSGLNGKVVGVIQGKPDTLVLEASAKARGFTITSRAYPDLNAIFDALRNGQVDAVVSEQVSLIALARSVKDIRVLSERLNNLPIGIALAQNDSAFKAFINLTLQDMFVDGTYTFLYKKWFDTTPLDLDVWPGAALINTALVAPTATPLPTVTPVFGAIDTPAPGQVQPTVLPSPTATPQK